MCCLGLGAMCIVRFERGYEALGTMDPSAVDIVVMLVPGTVRGE